MECVLARFGSGLGTGTVLLPALGFLKQGLHVRNAAATAHPSAQALIETGKAAAFWPTRDLAAGSLT